MAFCHLATTIGSVLGGDIVETTIIEIDPCFRVSVLYPKWLYFSCLALISFRLLQVKSISLSISKCIIQTSWKVLSGLFHLDHCQNFNRPTKIHSINGNIFRIYEKSPNRIQKIEKAAKSCETWPGRCQSITRQWAPKLPPNKDHWTCDGIRRIVFLISKRLQKVHLKNS